MLNFRNFTKLDEVFKYASRKKCIISESAFSRVLSTPKQIALIASTDSRIYTKVMNQLKEHQRCFPIVCYLRERQQIQPCILVCQKPDETGEQFKTRLNELYDIDVEHLAIIYRQADTTKVLFENAMVEFGKDPTITEYNKILSSIYREDTYILGIEVPLTESLATEYRKNNYIVFALNEEEVVKSFTWEEML